jgi:Tol biopolymer transport system component
VTGDRHEAVDVAELEARLRLTYRTVMPLLDVEDRHDGTDDDAPLITIDVALRRHVPWSRAKLVAVAAVVILLLGTAILVVVRITGGHPVKPTIQPAPGRSRIAYTRTGLSFSDARIVIADSDGANQRELTHTVNGPFDRYPKMSPDGTQIAFFREFAPLTYGTDIFVVGSDGTGEHRIDFGCREPCLGDTRPSWTPDGKHVIFQRVVGPAAPGTNTPVSAVLWEGDLDGRNVHRLSEPGIDGTYEDSYASVAPAGYIVFTRTRTADGLNAVFRMEPDGTHVRQLSPWLVGASVNLGAQVSPATSGPTRDLVVFIYGIAGHNPERRLGVIATVPATCRSDADCAARTQRLTSLEPTGTTDSGGADPAWSPDGTRIAYLIVSQPVSGGTFADIKGGIWTMTWDGQDRRLVVDTPRLESAPTWGPTPPSRP